jgi:uncharacterized repeat protein (TIGR01451 family)
VGAVGALVAGVALLYTPEAAGSVPLSLVVLDVAALGALGLAAWVARRRLTADNGRTVIPDVEFPLATPTPGDETDDLIYRLTTLREGTIEYREEIRDRVEAVAVTVLSRRENCSPEQASTRLAEGSWTDDNRAAAFFGAGATGTRRSVVSQFVRRFRDVETAYERQLRAVVDEIEALAGSGSTESSSDVSGTSSGREESVRSTMSPEAVRRGGERRQVTDTVSYLGTTRTGHWSGVAALSFAALGVGVLTSQPAVLLTSAVGVGLAGYARLGSPPSLALLSVARRVDEQTPQPGATVEVTVTVENEGESFLPDLSLVDRVPPTLTVVDGSPRLGTALRPGETATLSYTVVARRGNHDWPLEVVGRDLSGAVERVAELEAGTTLRCEPRLETLTETAVRAQTSAYAGEVATGTGGDGLEFFSLREYQPGDPESRVHWEQFARTGEFATIDFREEHAARVVLLFDGRESSYMSPSPGEPDALNRAVDAAVDVFASLSDQGHLVGIAAFNGVACWLGPGTGSLHRQRVRDLFVDHPAIAPIPPSLASTTEGRYVDPLVHVRRQLPSNTQLFLFSPLTDDHTYEVARRLDASGHLVTVISPDPTADDTVGRRLARLERSVRVGRLRDYGVRVVDWGPEDSFPLALERARRRWDA